MEAEQHGNDAKNGVVRGRRGAGCRAVACVLGLRRWPWALGRITVQSALGEPLRAEIDIPHITPEEAASLKASVASPEAFSAAGRGLQRRPFQPADHLQHRPDGRSFLRLTSDKRVSEPFVDLILEANWSSGRIVRDYTMLFDPPSLRQQARRPRRRRSSPAAPGSRCRLVRPRHLHRSRAPAAPARHPRAAPVSAVAPAPSATPAAQAARARRRQAQANRSRCKPGDTAGKIAAAPTSRPASRWTRCWSPCCAPTRTPSLQRQRQPHQGRRSPAAALRSRSQRHAVGRSAPDPGRPEP